MLTFVVARYKEDVSWLNELPSDSRIYLYNKGPHVDAAALPPQAEVIDLPNAGRESGTYLQHLMHRFDPTESEFTVFTQGDPFEHSPHMLELIRSWQRWNDIQPLALRWLKEKQIPPSALLDRERSDWIDHLAVRREHFSLTTWAPVGFFDQGAWGIGNNYRQNHLLPEGVNIMAHFLDLIGLKELAVQAEPAQIGAFSYGAIFAVRNSVVQRFLRIAGPHLEKMELLTRADLLYGYIFERSWLHLFGEPFVKLSRGSESFASVPRQPHAVSAKDLRARAFKCIEAGRDDDASHLLEQAIAAEPDDAELRSDMAALALRRGDYRGAVAHSSRALTTDPGNDAALFTMGLSLGALGEAVHASQSLEVLVGGARGANFRRENPDLYVLATRNLEALRAQALIPA